MFTLQMTGESLILHLPNGQVEELPLRGVPDELERQVEVVEADQHHRSADPRDREEQSHPAGPQVRSRRHLLRTSKSGLENT